MGMQKLIKETEIVKDANAKDNKDSSACKQTKMEDTRQHVYLILQRMQK